MTRCSAESQAAAAWSNSDETLFELRCYESSSWQCDSSCNSSLEIKHGSARPLCLTCVTYLSQMSLSFFIWVLWLSSARLVSRSVSWSKHITTFTSHTDVQSMLGQRTTRKNVVTVRVCRPWICYICTMCSGLVGAFNNAVVNVCLWLGTKPCGHS